MLDSKIQVVISNCYKKITLYNEKNQDNKNGVIFTKPIIAKEMINRLDPKLIETIFEPSVGSGVYIVALIEYILITYKLSGTQLKAYLENNVFFSDIDENSVAFTVELIEEFMFSCYKISNLLLNSFTGDSLAHVQSYDIIVGNPPYIRTKNIDKKYLQFLRENYLSCEKGNIDIYYAFIELANKLAKRSSLIVPNSYLTNVSAKNLRELMKINVSFIRDFKELKQFDNASTYTTILMLNKIATDFFSYAKYNEKPSLIKRETLNSKLWIIDKAVSICNYMGRTTKLSEIADVVTSINTNADKLYLLERVTLDKGFYKKIFEGNEYLIEEGICINLVKISKRFSSNLDQVIIFPYTGINTIMQEDYLSKNYPYAYKYFKAIEHLLRLRDNSKIDKYDSWYAYGRKQGFNKDFTNKKCFLVPVVYKKDNFLYEEYKSVSRFIHISGYVIIPKYGHIQQVRDILNSSDFLEYLDTYAKTMPGTEINYNIISTTTLKNYPYLCKNRVNNLIKQFEVSA